MTKKNTQLQVLNLNSPSEIMGFSRTLREYITQNKLSVRIQGSEYAMTDGWKFAGANFGIVPIVGEPVKISNDGMIATILFRKETKVYGNQSKTVDVPFFASINESRVAEFESDKVSKKLIIDYYAYKCSCELIRIDTEKKVGSGWATCSNLELKKVTFDEYAICSMSQTRSIGKSFRNLMGYVMKSAGYEPTPSEETDNVGTGQSNISTEPDAAEVLSNIELMTNQKELKAYYEQLSGGLQQNKNIRSAFKVRENQFKS